MENIELLETYFPDISDLQKKQLLQLPGLYKYHNAKINVISRKDIDNLFIRHILHSLSIAEIFNFPDESKILDVGTGGGFPGIPLAILFPRARFMLIDSVGKKIKVTNNIARELGLNNVKTQQIKSTVLKGSFDFILGRAVAAFPSFYDSVKHLLSKKNPENGIFYLKGGDFSDELKRFKNVNIYLLKDIFKDDFFETKKIIYLKKNDLSGLKK